MKLAVKRLAPSAKLPVFANPHDAGLDLYALESVTLLPHERAQLRTGIALAIPPGYVGLIWDKSGLSHRFGLKTIGGVIDSGYRGEVLVGLINTGSESHTFAPGDKIAQILIQQVEAPEIYEVDELDETVRGAQGFGSSGM